MKPYITNHRISSKAKTTHLSESDTQTLTTVRTMQSRNNTPNQSTQPCTKTNGISNIKNTVEQNKPRLVSAPEIHAYLRTVDELHIDDDEIVKCVIKFMRTMRKAGWKNHEGRKITNWKARVKGYALTWQKNVDAAQAPEQEETNP